MCERGRAESVRGRTVCRSEREDSLCVRERARPVCVRGRIAFEREDSMAERCMCERETGQWRAVCVGDM